MKSLKQYIFEALIKEGGKAVDGTPMTQKQAKEVFDDVVKHLLPLFGLEEENTDYAALGSFGKKHQDQTSGDIDIAVSLEKMAGFFGISVDEVENKIREILDEKDLYYVMNKGLHVISTRWPIPNTKGLYGQVDIMPSYNMEFSKWMYHSPDFTKAESKYKGLYRNQLIMLTLKNVDQKVLSRNEKDEVMEFERYALRLNSGLARTVRSHIGKRRRKKTPEAIKELEKQVRLRWKLYNIDEKTGKAKPFDEKLITGEYIFKGKNRELAISKGRPIKMDKLCITTLYTI